MTEPKNPLGAYEMDMLEMWDNYARQMKYPPKGEMRAAFLAGYMAGSGHQWKRAEQHQRKCTAQIHRLLMEERNGNPDEHPCQ